MKSQYICRMTPAALTLIFLIAAMPAMAQKTILIAYHSETGRTEEMAKAVAYGAGSIDGVDVLLKPTNRVTVKELINADAIILGSPVYNANVSPEVSRFIASWPFEDAPLANKIGAAFATGGGISAGEEIVQMNILQSMLIFGMIVVGGPDWIQPFGASAVTGEEPFATDNPGDIDPLFLDKGRKLGERVAKVVIAFDSDK